MLTKSTPRWPLLISSTRSSQKLMLPTADLMPTGSPVSSPSISTKSSIESTSPNTSCRLGDAQSTPALMPRISAISSLTLAPGSIPPRPGFAPCDSLISRARTGALATRSLSRDSSKWPSSSRQPKYAVPIWKTMSPPLRWYDDSPPSPVFWRQPARAAPRLSASMAFAESDPKLMPEMLTTDCGRKARARPRAAPTTFAAGSGTPSSACRAVDAAGPANVRCLMIG